MTTVAVIVLVIEAIWKSVSPFTSSGWSTFVTPHPPSSSRPSFQMPTAMPGTWYVAMPSRTRASRRGSTGEAYRYARHDVRLGELLSKSSDFRLRQPDRGKESLYPAVLRDPFHRTVDLFGPRIEGRAQLRAFRQVDLARCPFVIERADLVIRGEIVVTDSGHRAAREAQEQCGHETGALLSGMTVDDDATVGLIEHTPHDSSDIRRREFQDERESALALFGIVQRIPIRRADERFAHVGHPTGPPAAGIEWIQLDRV